MGLSTHVLDTMHGCPAAGMQVSLYTTEGQFATLVKTFQTEWRTAAIQMGLCTTTPVCKRAPIAWAFDVAGYFKAKGVQLPEPSFLNLVTLDFGVANVTETLTTCPFWSALGVTRPTAARKSQLFLLDFAPERGELLKSNSFRINPQPLPP